MVDLGGGVVFGSIVIRFWGPLNDGVEFEGWCYLDERDMENLCRHPERLSAWLKSIRRS